MVCTTNFNRNRSRCVFYVNLTFNRLHIPSGFFNFVNMGIDELCKRDADWRAMAFRITSDRALADDIVQDMYLKLYDRENINQAYVYFTLRSLFIDHIRANKNTIPYELEPVDIPDEQPQPIPDVEDLINSLSYLEQEVFIGATLYGQRELARRSGVHIQTIHRINKNVKKKLWQKAEKSRED